MEGGDKGEGQGGAGAGGRRCAHAAERAICHVARGAQAGDADPAGVVGRGAHGVTVPKKQENSLYFNSLC